MYSVSQKKIKINKQLNFLLSEEKGKGYRRIKGELNNSHIAGHVLCQKQN